VVAYQRGLIAWVVAFWVATYQRWAMPRSRWTSFVADAERPRILHEDGNAAHRLRVEHDRERLYVELSGEDGKGPWTVLAVDRETRRYTVAQAETKTQATRDAADALSQRGQ
jgi:hypothetical protein